jgi:hypothetical protein
MMKTTEIYYPDGHVLVREWPTGTRPYYKWQQRAVGGLIQLVVGHGLTEGVSVFCNEEGRLRDLTVNIPGMIAIKWPEPPQGWETLNTKAPPHSGPIVLSSGMSLHELRAALARRPSWSPVVGPILVMRGWSEEELGDDEPLNPDDLGVEETKC